MRMDAAAGSTVELVPDSAALEYDKPPEEAPSTGLDGGVMLWPQDGEVDDGGGHIAAVLEVDATHDTTQSRV